MLCYGSSSIVRQWCLNNEAERNILTSNFLLDSSKRSYLYDICTNLCPEVRNGIDARCKISFNYDESQSVDSLPTRVAIEFHLTTAPTIERRFGDLNYCAISSGRFSCCDIGADQSHSQDIYDQCKELCGQKLIDVESQWSFGIEIW